ncbi:hypothetical protein M9Y10_043914 [Tritrichomonas musculus]|uniref:Initiator binding domain-containing protein n=1 Tax=Tritrichomonas musculus TaxID=1915356 RepID=A0ABR2K112_9EUKA
MATKKGSNGQTSPKYWWLLNEPDRTGYTYLRTFIKNNPESNQRNKRLTSFTDMLEIIRRYAIRGDSGDANRCLVCGILWLPGAIAINTHQLGFLMDKCKSSINGSLQILGYKETISRKTASDLVAKALLAIRDDRSELRKWTVRCIDDTLLDLSSLNEEQPPQQKQQQDQQQNSNNEKPIVTQPVPNPIQFQYTPIPINIPTQIIQAPFNYPMAASVAPIQSIPPQPIQQQQQQLHYQMEQTQKQIQEPLQTKQKAPIQKQNEEITPSSSMNGEFHPFSNFAFPIPPKKGQFDHKTNHTGLEASHSTNLIDFSKEDAFISNALSGFNENMDSSNDFWNIEMLQGDSFFL